MAANDDDLKLSVGEALERAIWRRVGLISVPVHYRGVVTTGYGRGSASLGIPTANLGVDVMKGGRWTEKDGWPLMCPGVYCGWAFLHEDDDAKKEEKSARQDRGPMKMVMSFGFSPFYDNPHCTLEVFMFKDFGTQTLVGRTVSIWVMGFIRCEESYTDFGHLIKAIRNDCRVAAQMDLPESPPPLYD